MTRTTVFSECVLSTHAVVNVNRPDDDFQVGERSTLARAVPAAWDRFQLANGSVGIQHASKTRLSGSRESPRVPWRPDGLSQAAMGACSASCR